MNERNRRWMLSMGIAMGAACGPGTPNDGKGDASTTAVSTTAAVSTTSTTGPGTTGPTTGAGTTTLVEGTTTVAGTTVAETTTAATTATDASAGEDTADMCVIDPAQGLCSSGCLLQDCCKCDTTEIDLASIEDCSFPAGIVTGHCPWKIESVSLDGASASASIDCKDPGAVWQEDEIGGDIIVTLCNDACAAVVGGEVRSLSMYVFCEAA